MDKEPLPGAEAMVHYSKRRIDFLKADYKSAFGRQANRNSERDLLRLLSILSTLVERRPWIFVNQDGYFSIRLTDPYTAYSDTDIFLFDNKVIFRYPKGRPDGPPVTVEGTSTVDEIVCLPEISERIGAICELA